MYSLPVNLHTINQFFGTTMSPAEAQAFIAAKAEPRDEIVSFEDQGLAFVGREIYDAFLAGYTRKQWGTDPTDLPASILQRLPLRFNYEDSYFNHPYQAIPAEGYTPIVAAILDHPGIEVRLSTALHRGDPFDHVVWTGPDRRLLRVRARPPRLPHARLPARRPRRRLPGLPGHELLRSRRAVHADHRAQALRPVGVARPHASRTPSSAAAAEPDDIPYYPIRRVKEKAQLLEYVGLARAVEHVTFVGRLGTYRYLDMDVTIKEALDAAAVIRDGLATGEPIPAFSVDPLA